jgi:hypothetical protein
MVAYAPRYAEVVAGTDQAFHPPKSVRGLSVAERLEGDATTDFGAPSITPAADLRVVPMRELDRLCDLLKACWAALDRAVEAAGDKDLRTGPRGGGRQTAKIVAHVTGAEAGYARRLAATPPAVDESVAPQVMAQVRATVIDAVRRGVTDGLPQAGPRGGKIWAPRYFVRRDAWHVLDHAWEIEDRS